MPGTREGLTEEARELLAEDEKRLQKLFDTLDLDGNGRVDVHDLSKALHQVGVHQHYAEVLSIQYNLYSRNLHLDSLLIVVHLHSIAAKVVHLEIRLICKSN